MARIRAFPRSRGSASAARNVDHHASVCATMTTVVAATAFGGPECLAVLDLPVGQPGPGQVLLDVRAAGVNPADWKSYSGLWGADPAKLPIRLGYEAAGVVV